jgi:tRNA G37 N-methylase Trm5
MTSSQTPRTSFATRRSVLAWCVAGIAGGLLGLPAGAQTAVAPARPLDVPFEPSQQFVVDRMLEIAGVNQGDLLYDLGSGDGRIVITAAKKYGARGVGIDLDPQRVAEAKANAKKAGVEAKVQFKVGDLFQSDFSDATVVTLFLFPQVNRKLRPHLWRQLKVGTRVVSHVWDMGPEWPPQKTELIQGRKIHFWTITEAHKKASGQ